MSSTLKNFQSLKPGVLQVGKPLVVDLTTRNQIRSSCAKVNVKVNLVAKLPQRVRINKEDDVTGEIKSKGIKIQHDYMPKYCRKCCLQGYDKTIYWTKYPEILEEKHEAKQMDKAQVGSDANKR